MSPISLCNVNESMICKINSSLTTHSLVSLQQRNFIVIVIVETNHSAGGHSVGEIEKRVRTHINSRRILENCQSREKSSAGRLGLQMASQKENANQAI